MSPQAQRRTVRIFFLSLATVLAALSVAGPASAMPRGTWAEVDDMTSAELATVKSLGYDFVWAKANTTDLDRAHAAGLKAAVWLGKWYDDNDTDGPQCTWQKSDAQIASLVNSVKSHPAVAYWFLDDEPHDLCANVRSQFLARNAHVKSLDSTHPTFITENRTEAFDSLANVTDVLALIAYPCNWNNMTSCSSTNVPGRIAAANAAGVAHYWKVPPTFEEPKFCNSGSHYRFPSATEYAKLEEQWKASPSRVEGSFAFAGTAPYSCSLGLLSNPALFDAVRAENGATGTPPPPPACSDGRDNDGDAKIDYPADPGCTAATDTDEADAVTPPPGTAVTVTAPTAGQTVSGTFRFNVKASSSVRRVDYIVDGGATVYDDSATDFSEMWSSGTIANGSHRLVARATLTDGTKSESPAVQFTVAN